MEELIKKRDEETNYEYGLRLIKLKKDGVVDIDWGEIVKLTGLELNKDSLRKANDTMYGGYNVAKYYEDKIANMKNNSDNNSEIKELIQEYEEKRLLAEKEIKKLQTLNVERNKLTRVEGRKELFYESIGRTIERLPLPEFKPIDNVIELDSEYLLAWADIHYNANFKSTNNEYSREECVRRFEVLTGKVIDLVKSKGITKLHIVGCGDDIAGILRLTDLRLNETTVVESVVEVSRLIASVLNEISSVCEVEYYHTMASNHTQMRNLGTKANELRAEDVEFIIGNYIKDLLKDNYRVTVNLTDKEYQSFELVGQNIIALHGHQIKNIKKVINDLSQLHRKFYDIALLGHLHGGQSISVGEGNGNTEVKIVPSIVGSDPYSDTLMVGSKSMSKLYKIERNYGITEEYTFVLN